MSFCTKCGFPQQDCHCDLRAFLAEKRIEDGIAKFVEQSNEPAKWLSPADEVLAADRLREIASQTALGYPCTPADAHFAAQTALSLIQSRQATRSSLLETMKEMRELEAQIATLKAHLHRTPSSEPAKTESHTEWWVVDHADNDRKISGPFPTAESAAVSREHIETTQTAEQDIKRNLWVMQFQPCTPPAP